MAVVSVTYNERSMRARQDAFEPGLVSVIVPNFNNAHYLPEAIRSVLAQTYRNQEIIVVDDGSTDESRAVVKQYGDQVYYLWQENQGLAGARNTGIRAARGEFIGLLDADDQWGPTYLEKMVALAGEHAEATVYFCGAQCMDEAGRELPRILGSPVTSPEKVYEVLVRANYLIPSTILMRHAAVREAGLFDPTLRSCEDWDLWLRMAPHHRFQGMAEPLVRYRIHNASLSANLAGMHQAAAATIRKNFGPDDDRWDSWQPIKRRAYGGLYRYFALTSVQRRNEWGVGAAFLQRALAIDPTLAQDVELFYELAFGTQSTGIRGTAEGVDIAGNADALLEMLAAAFVPPLNEDKTVTYRQALGTAHFALGLAAYNVIEPSLSRNHLLRALSYRPELWRDARMRGDLIKSLAGKSITGWVRQRSWAR